MSKAAPADAIAVIVNRDGGTAKTAGADLPAQVEAAFDQAGLKADMHLVTGRDIGDAVRAHASDKIVAVGGGDGTLGSAAAALLDARGSASLAILPLGTHNHLAQQLDIPGDLAGAATVIAQAHSRMIDVAEVNGRVFLNNASIGLYPLLVRSREQEQRRHGTPKWLANLVAARAVLRRVRHHRLRVEIEGAARTIRTPLLFVGNNVYSLDRGEIGRRAALDEGRLSLFAVAAGSRLGALWFALKTLAGRADLRRDFAAVEACRAITVSAHAEHIHVALDGEVHRLPTPLRFGIRPRALHVIAP